MAPAAQGAAASRPLDQAAASSLPGALLGLGVIFVTFAAFDLVFYAADVRARLFVADGLCGVGLLAGGLVARRRGVAPQHAHPLMTTVALATLANVVYGIGVGSEPVESVYLILIVMGTGAIFLSWRWNLAVVGAVFAAWLVLASAVPMAGSLTQYALGLFGACAVSMLMCGVRIRMAKESILLRSRLDAVVTGAPIVLFTLDRSGAVTLVRGQGLAALGAEPERLVGRSIFELLADVEHVSRDVSRALGGEAFSTNLRVSDRALVVSFAPLHDAAGHVEGVVGVATDVTDQARAERELEASRRHLTRQERLAALGTLVAGVAHEINNPLAFVRGNTQLTRTVLDALASDPALPDARRTEVREVLELQAATLEGVDRLSHISESLRSVARSSGGRRAMQDLNAVARMSLTVARPRIAKSIQVEEDLRARGAVLADRAELTQVALNLLINAADELGEREGARIVVRSFDEGARVVLEVEDNGRGIDPARSELVFAPFVTTKANGTGLGLSISHRIVSDHGGRLSFTSRPGRTVFHVELPVAAPLTPEARA